MMDTKVPYYGCLITYCDMSEGVRTSLLQLKYFTLFKLKYCGNYLNVALRSAKYT
jgi:hypothetical protein